MSRLSRLSRSIDGKVAIITGAASGMGRATAHLFSDEGARVVVADLGRDSAAAVVTEISAAHGADRALGVECDVADHDQLRSLVEATVQQFGRLDILVNNAGVSMINSAFQPEDEFEVNWATIVTTAGLAAYAATKAGVVGLTKSLAVELGRHGVTVNCVCPGPIDTGMTAGIEVEAKEKYARRRVPLRRYGIPEEVAHMTLNLCMPASSFVNGTSIPVDGGMTIRHT